jgi:hypothetical protein
MPGPILIDARPARIRNPLPKKWIDQITKARVWLVNLTDQTHVLQRNYGCYFIHGAKEGERYTVTPVNGRITTLDEGDNIRGQQMVEAEDIAQDLAMQINTGILTEEGEESFGGAFVSETEKPAEKDLLKHERLLVAFYDAQIRLGNKFWDDPNDHKNVSAIMRRAARIRGTKPAWVFDPTPSTACAACGESLRVGVPVCKTCGAIQPGMEEKARKFFPERFAAETTPPAETAQPAAPSPRRSRRTPPAPAQP